MGEEARRGGGQAQAKAQVVNPNCPNAANPFHRCAEYCPVAPPVPTAVKPSPGRAAAVQNRRVHSDGDIVAQNGRVHSDGDIVALNGKVHSEGDVGGDGDLKPRPHRRDRSNGSGGLPLYVFLREGSDGGGKKVDPRCPNAANPFHVCTDHCLAKMADASRSSEGGKSPISLFSRNSRNSRNSHRSSSSEDGSVKSGASKKVDPTCPNAGNPFHQCSEHCTGKMKEVAKQKGIGKNSPRRKAGKEVSAVQNWKVDPRCPNAGNPFHICAQYCFDHLNESASAPKAANKPDSRKGKAVVKAEQTGDINPDCVNASNPYHKCGEYCKRNGNR